MKNKLNETEKAKLERLITTNETNSMVSELNNILIENSLLLSKNLQNEHNFSNLFFESGICFDEEEVKNLNTLYNLKEFVKLDTKIYSENLYYKSIKPFKIKQLKITLTSDDYKPYQLFLYKDVECDQKTSFREINKLAFFDKSFPFISLKEDGTTWMSITPHEINTMQDDIDEVKGNVLVLGLGLGYFPFMISHKRDVEKIIIIEKDKSIIRIFKENVLTQFEFKNKIEIIEDDAFNFLRNSANHDYFDYLYCDLYHNEIDGSEIYAKIVKEERKFKHTKFLYWIEPSIICFYRRAIINLLQEELIEKETNIDYTKSFSFFDEIVNKFHFILKNEVINNYQDIENLLSSSSIKKLINLL